MLSGVLGAKFARFITCSCCHHRTFAWLAVSCGGASLTEVGFSFNVFSVSSTSDLMSFKDVTASSKLIKNYVRSLPNIAPPRILISKISFLSLAILSSNIFAVLTLVQLSISGAWMKSLHLSQSAGYYQFQSVVLSAYRRGD